MKHKIERTGSLRDKLGGTLKDKLGGHNYFICGYGCGTLIAKDKELKLFIEQFTDRVHTIKRCDEIKARIKEEYKINNGRYCRKYIILELRQIIDEMPQDSKLIDVMIELFKNRTKKEDAVTLKELSMSIFPSRIYKDQTGDNEPLPEAVRETSTILSKMRKHQKNKDITVFAVKFDDGCYYYYNMPKHEEFKPVKKRLTNQIFGLEETIGRTESILDVKEGIVKTHEIPESNESTVQDYDLDKVLDTKNQQYLLQKKKRNFKKQLREINNDRNLTERDKRKKIKRLMQEHNIREDT